MPTKKQNKNQKKMKAVKPVVLANNVSPRPVRTPRAKNSKPKAKAAHIHNVCAVTNPFCPAAKGTRWADGTGGSTISEQFRGNLAMNSSTAGTGVWTFAPTAPFGYSIYSAATGTTGTVGSYVTYKTGSMLGTYGAAYRIVSFGVIIRCIASATSAQGIVTLGTSGSTPAATTVITLGSENYNEVAVKAIQPGMELSWISKPIGSSSREFIAPSTSTPSSVSWTTLVVEMQAGPGSTNMLMAEWFMNVEFQIGVTSAIAPLAKQALTSPATSTLSMRTANSLGSLFEGGVSQVEAAVWNKAETAITTFLSDPLESLAGLFV